MKTFAVISLLLIVATSAFAHAGEVHTYLGTVTKLHGHEFTMKTESGHDVDVLTTANTQFLHADNHAAAFGDLRPGIRVAVRISKDGRTAMSVRMGPPPAN